MWPTLVLILERCLNIPLLGWAFFLQSKWNNLSKFIFTLYEPQTSSAPIYRQKVCFLCVLYPLQICSWRKLGRGVLNQWWHKMVLCVSDSFFFVVIKAVVKWPFCLLPQRLVFQNPEQMVCVFHGWITEPGGFCVVALDSVMPVCVRPPALALWIHLCH